MNDSRNSDSLQPSMIHKKMTSSKKQVNSEPPKGLAAKKVSTLECYIDDAVRLVSGHKNLKRLTASANDLWKKIYAKCYIDRNALDLLEDCIKSHDEYLHCFEHPTCIIQRGRGRVIKEHTTGKQFWRLKTLKILKCAKKYRWRMPQNPPPQAGQEQTFFKTCLKSGECLCTAESISGL